MCPYMATRLLNVSDAWLHIPEDGCAIAQQIAGFVPRTLP